MLALTRRTNESITIPQYGITITVTSVDRGTVRIGIEAPADVRVWRSEIAPKPTTTRITTNTSGE